MTNFLKNLFTRFTKFTHWTMEEKNGKKNLPKKKLQISLMNATKNHTSPQKNSKNSKESLKPGKKQQQQICENLIFKTNLTKLKKDAR